MAGAIHRILLGNQEAAATWLPFAMGQFYACPEGAQTSFTPVPGVTILIKRVGGQDVVQIKADGGVDFVFMKRGIVYGAYPAPIQFIPNNPVGVIKPVSSTRRTYMSILMQDMMFTSHLEGPEISPDTECKVVNTVWRNMGNFIQKVGGYDTVFPPDDYFMRAILPHVGFSTQPWLNAEDHSLGRFTRLVSIEPFEITDDPFGSVGMFRYSDDMGLTWEEVPLNHFVIVPTAAAFVPLSVGRIDVDTQVLYAMVIDRDTGFLGDLVHIVLREGGMVWSQGTYNVIPFDPEVHLYNHYLARFIPGKDPGVIIGIVRENHVAPASDDTADNRISAIRSDDGGVTFYVTQTLLAPDPLNTDAFGLEFIELVALSAIRQNPLYPGTFACMAPITAASSDGLYNFRFRIIHTEDYGVTWGISDESLVSISSAPPEPGSWGVTLRLIGFYGKDLYLHVIYEQSETGRTYIKVFSTPDFGVTLKEVTKPLIIEPDGTRSDAALPFPRNRSEFMHRSDMA